jgi:hypothetical protein
MLTIEAAESPDQIQIHSLIKILTAQLKIIGYIYFHLLSLLEIINELNLFTTSSYILISAMDAIITNWGAGLYPEICLI